MSRVWFCRSCGYEVNFKGRCHECGRKLSTSPLAELEVGNEDDEVGYRLGEWADEARGRLIVRLIERSVVHRFEDEELVIGSKDEEKTDVIFAEFESGEVADSESTTLDQDQSSTEEPAIQISPHEQARLLEGVAMLRSAASRLMVDPTDMDADTDVAHASSEVLVTDSFPGLDDEIWDAVGRVTRRLLGALGADEALDDDIKMQSAILHRLLDEGFEDSAASASEVPGVTGVPADTEAPGTTGAPETSESASDSDSRGAVVESGQAEEDQPALRTEADEAAEHSDGDDEQFQRFASGEDSEGQQADDADRSPDEGGTDHGEDDQGGSESIYELPDWRPEQRVQLSILLDRAGITHSWEEGDLVVAVADEDRAEALFVEVDGVEGDEDDEARYRSLEELFAATGRLLADPNSTEKATEVGRMCSAVGGPTPIGVPDGTWWSLRAKARRLSESIESGSPLDEIFDQTRIIRDLLRELM